MGKLLILFGVLGPLAIDTFWRTTGNWREPEDAIKLTFGYPFS